jgi:kinetochore protein Nuf2
LRIRRSVCPPTPCRQPDLTTTPVDDQENLVNEISRVTDANLDTRGRIVRSPERIKRDISAFRDKAQEDKKTVTAHEMKSRDLEAKLEALSVFEEVRSRRPMERDE